MKGFGKRGGLHEMSEGAPFSDNYYTTQQEDPWMMSAIHAVMPPGIPQPIEPSKPAVKTWNRFDALTETESEQEFPLIKGDFKVIDRQKQMKMPRFQKPTGKARLPEKQKDDFWAAISREYNRHHREEDVRAQTPTPSTCGSVEGPGQRRVLGFLGPLAPASSDLNELGHGDDQKWEEEVSIVDPGAVDSVAPMSIVRNVKAKDSNGSTNGQYYHTADGTRLPNLGEKTFNAVPAEGSRVRQTLQITEVTRPLSSVGKTTDGNNFVVFGRRGGYIWDLDSNQTTPFKREHGVYMLRTWVEARGPQQQQSSPQESSFGRQG